MYLSSIDLFGFKSFAVRTRINFQPGLTAIVGPNGCGKSNLVDAVRWVLGEQREAALRSERMENVIFGGTGKRRPLGVAEISMTMHDTDGALPVEYEEVTVTRRLFRSGKSEYLLNKNVCRLRDIVDLFSGTGISAESYSIIELKMVEDILSGNPEEMRRLLDEAIGITRYKARRKEALRKLLDARQDRERALDILTEVEGQAKALHRQVTRVQSYKRLQDKARRVSAALTLATVKDLESRLAPLSGSLDQFKVQMETISGELSAAEAGLIRLETEALKLEEERTGYADQTAAAQAVHQELALHKTQREEEHRATFWRIGKNREERESITAELERLALQITSAQTVLKQRQEGFPVLQEQLDKTQGAFNQTDEQFRTVRQATQDGRAGIAALREQETQTIRSLERRAAQIKSLEDRSADLTARLQELEIRLTTRHGEIEALQSELDQKDLLAKAARQTCADLDQNAEELRGRLRQAERDLDQNAALRSQIQIQTLHFQELHRRGSPLYAAGGPLAAKFPETISAALGDELVVEERCQKAVETALQGMIYSRVLDDSTQLESLVSLLSTEKLGRAALLVGNPPEGEADPAPDFAREFGGEALSTSVTGNTRTAAWVRHLLRGVVLVAGVEKLQSLADPAGRRSLILVTPDGEFTDGKGFWVIGATRDEPPRVQGLSNRMKELARQAKTAEARHTELQDQLTKLKSDLVTVQQQLAAANEALLKAEQARETKAREKLQVEAQASSAHLLLEQLRREAQEVAVKLEEFSPDGQTGDPDLPAIMARLQAMETDQQRQEALEAEAMEAREAARQILAQMQIEFERARAELNRVKDQAAGLQNRHDELSTRSANLEAENLQLEERRTQLEAELGDWGVKVAQAAENLTVLRGKLEDFDLHRREIQESQRNQSAHVRDLRTSFEQVSSQMHQGELQCVEIEATLREDRRKLEGVDLDSLANEDPNAEVLAKLEKKILSLEPLNLAAEAEYKVAEERVNFLNDQLKDLNQAEADLQQTVAALNQEARVRFEAGFERIRANLQRIFLDIFEGGSADVRLSGDDPLESRIELVAAPPGKRIGSLTLLSGGEKALTAISLLFAIYLEKPSPFCILDEVDAPLDEENTGRFCRMLMKFSEKTQFLVITHNKRTMTEAQQLIGITMEEEGISKVVPVKLN
jgi:chromosome segregation protein